MSYDNDSYHPVGGTPREKPIFHDQTEGDYYKKQYASMSPSTQSTSRRSGGGKSSSDPWSFSWTFAFVGALIAFGIAASNQAPSPGAAALVFGVLAGTFHQVIKFLVGLAVIGFVLMVIYKAITG